MRCADCKRDSVTSTVTIDGRTSDPLCRWCLDRRATTNPERLESTCSTNKYRKKPIVIEAILWDGINLAEVQRFCGSCAEWSCWQLNIVTFEGRMVAHCGDWIIKGVKGEFYPCRPDIFAATYERLEDNE